jgi:hypothetical protein
MRCKKLHRFYLLVWCAQAREWHVADRLRAVSRQSAESVACNRHPDLSGQWAVVTLAELDGARAADPRVALADVAGFLDDLSALEQCSSQAELDATYSRQVAAHAASDTLYPSLHAALS